METDVISQSHACSARRAEGVEWPMARAWASVLEDPNRQSKGLLPGPRVWLWILWVAGLGVASVPAPRSPDLVVQVLRC